MLAATPVLQWDIFCKVIDNFGDIGVCWRLASDLVQRGGHQVRLWVDDASALGWMAADADRAGPSQVEVIVWNAETLAGCAARLQSQPCDVLIEAFGCEIAIEMIAAYAGIHWAGGTFDTQKEPFLPLFEPFEPAQPAQPTQTANWPVWINLEYLTSEPYAARCHGLMSPVQHGPGKGQSKFFYYPGFIPATGGLLREPGLRARQAAFDVQAWRRRFVQQLEDSQKEDESHPPVDKNNALVVQTLAPKGESVNPVWISLFCYEPAALPHFLQDLANHGFAGRSVRLLVASGRASQAMQAAFEKAFKTPVFKHPIGLQPNKHLHKLLSISYLPLTTQDGYDQLLWACDFNCVRGEDSLVRAIWAGKPLLWQAYPQDGGAQAAKVEALLEALDMPPALRQLHRFWNREVNEQASREANSATSAADACADATSNQLLSPLHLTLPVDESSWAAWQASAKAARARLLEQEDLATRLIAFARHSNQKANSTI